MSYFNIVNKNIGPTGPKGEQGSMGIDEINRNIIGGTTKNISYGILNKNSVFIGNEAGSLLNSTTQSNIAVGNQAGSINQSSSSVAVGNHAGYLQQGSSSIAIGLAGSNTQGNFSIAMGYRAGMFTQGNNCIAIGSQAGYLGQGNNSIAIGNLAGRTLQAQNTIILNSTGVILNSTEANALYIKPVRSVVTNNPTVACYNNSTGEIYYSSKTFVIDHPVKDDSYLVHACLEGPENGVYYRGISDIICGEKKVSVKLPEYVTKISRNITIHITQIHDSDDTELGIFSSSEVDKDGMFTVRSNVSGKFTWLAVGSRYPDIKVEPKKSDVKVMGDGPYRYIL